VPASPETPAIKSEIKGRKGLNRDEGQDTDFSVQLFLHLAEEFDRESNDLNQQLAMVDNQYQSLQRSFQQDQDEGSVGAGISTQPVAAGTENPRPLVFDKRMVAWNHLFQKDSAPSSLLFTDSETAFDGLLEQVEEKVELLKVDAPAADGNTPAQGPWPEQVPEILQKVLMTPWDPGLLDEVRVIGQEIASGADAWQKSGAPSEDRVYSIIWFAVPGLNGRTLLNRRLGRQEETGGGDGIKNTVVGLVQERRKHL
jgi:hypothetical protein